ncbi:hypothetical protein [Umezawaea sp. Da 62-37]|uniref:hypothetical protein n=1 Tax=Umezawaea sp. Da 62-37 TaxID=3075927 RepID=UPI0028F71D0B|nr:hypothetical protein [Umezawaea sp. Da 62-37]WNV89529.1 hypothetical protein RM788_14870 [Umezawaea sp. Da 62-37]
MWAYVSTLSVHKDGATPEECEDAAGVVPVIESDEPTDGAVSVAVSDGASESLLAGPWARLLVESTVEAVRAKPEVLHSDSGFARVVLDAVDDWDGWLAGYIAGREAEDRPIKWYEQPGLDRGAYATLLAFHLTDVGLWHAAALGDSCLFQVRSDRLLRAFPVETAVALGTSPALLNSRNRDEALIASKAGLANGDYEEGDQFFLGTDAIAHWFLSEVEQDDCPWEVLRDLSAIGSQEAFAKWVADERAGGRMKNDDVTLVHVDLG